MKRHLADYLEGDLELDQRALLDAHLDECGACAGEVRELQQTVQLLRAMPEPEPPPMLAADVIRRIRSGEADAGFFERWFGGLTSVLEPAFVLPASAIAVAAVVVAFVQEPKLVVPWSPSAGRVEDAAAAPGVSSEALARFERGLIGFERGLAAEADRIGTPGPIGLAQEPRGPRIRVRLPIAPPSMAAASADAQLRPGSGERRSDHFGTAAPGARVAASAGSGVPLAAASSGGADPRDEWLALGLQDPVALAHFLSSKNLAEHELWVDRLADRAQAIGRLDELVEALRRSGDLEAAILSDDFAAKAQDDSILLPAASRTTRVFSR